MKRKQKSLPKLKAELQLVFNAYIRERDKDLPCISCGLMKQNKQAGHYYSVRGYDGLRYNEFNVNGECSGCNCFDDSHLITYGENLFNRIGSANFEKLKLDAKIYKAIGYKFSKSEIIEKIEYYKTKIKELI
jgi:hypothetical protein